MLYGRLALGYQAGKICLAMLIRLRCTIYMKAKKSGLLNAALSDAA